MNSPKCLKIEPSPVGYFEYYFTSYNFILLIPFRLRRSSENPNVIICKKNLIHQILCGILLLCTLIFNYIVYFIETIHLDIYAKPIWLFNVALSIILLFYCVVFVSVCWRNTEEILNFANLSSSNFLCKSKLFYAILRIYPLVLEVLLMNRFHKYFSFPTRENWYMYIYDGALGIGIFMSIFLTNFMDTYVAILVLSGYNQIRSSVHYLDQLRQRKTTEIQWKIGEFSCLVEISKKLQQYFKSLNLIGSPIILPWFCALVPWVSYKLVISLPGTDIIQKDSLLSSFTKLNQHVIDQVFYWAYFGLYLGILVLSAEIKRECDDLKRVMKEMILQYDPKLFKGKAALVQIEQLLGNVGIHGGYFFNFSYRFLGSAAGLIVAYAFLALQLRLNCCST